MKKQLSLHTAKAVDLFVRFVRFSIVIGSFYIIYRLLLVQTLDGSKQLLPLFLLWIISAYIVLPKIHRILTDYYLPNYFVGRVRSPSGLLSDPINVAFFGNEKQIHRAMSRTNWQLAEPLTIRSTSKIIKALFLKQSYPTAPVGHMYLFNRRQDFAYQQEVGGSPHTRHHIRFWRVPEGWRLPGGHRADWLAAATYDRSLGIKLATGQIDHLIHEDIDAERDHIITTLQEAGVIKNLEVVEHFTDAYHGRNNGGDNIRTDGSLPFITL